MAGFAPCIVPSHNSYYHTIPLQQNYHVGSWGTDHNMYRHFKYDHSSTLYTDEPIYYIEADNVSYTVEPEPQQYSDWHTDVLFALKEKDPNTGEEVFSGKVIVYQHYTSGVSMDGNDIKILYLETRVGLYDTENNTFTEWTSDHIGFGGGRYGKNPRIYFTGIYELHEDDIWFGPAFLGIWDDTNLGGQVFQFEGEALSKNWIAENYADDWRVITDPNDQDPEGPSGPGGGGGDHDPGGDIVPPPGVGPINNIAYGGFITFYKVNKSRLEQLGAAMYGSTWTDILHNFFNKPQDMVAGLMMLPITPADDGHLYQPRVGLQNFGPNMPIVSAQFVQVTMGTVDLNEYYGSALDYSPNTKIEIFLPFIGVRELDVDEVMGKRIQVKYNIDCYNGDCVALISVLEQAPAGYALRYQFSGSCGQQLPTSSADFSNIISNCISLVASVGAAVVSGGASVPAEAAAGAVAAASVNTVTNSKARITKSGNLGGSTGVMSCLTPYIIKTVPRQSLPENYKHFEGYPSNISGLLSSFSGFTVVDMVHLQNIPCTDAELAEIESLLKEGVIL